MLMYQHNIKFHAIIQPREKRIIFPFGYKNKLGYLTIEKKKSLEKNRHCKKYICLFGAKTALFLLYERTANSPLDREYSL